MYYYVLFALLYIVVAVWFFGLYFAYWQRNWPLIAQEKRSRDIMESLLFSIIWPISLTPFTIHVLTGDKKFKGLKFK